MDKKEKYAHGKNPNSLKNLKKLEKGTILNPEGARAHSPEIRAARKLTNEYLKEVIDIAVMGNMEGLQEIVKDKNSPVIKVIVAKCLYDAVKNGSWDLAEKIISRIVGKIPDKIEHSSLDGLSRIQVNFVKPESK